MGAEVKNSVLRFKKLRLPRLASFVRRAAEVIVQRSPMLDGLLESDGPKLAFMNYTQSMAI